MVLEELVDHLFAGLDIEFLPDRLVLVDVGPPAICRSIDSAEFYFLLVAQMAERGVAALVALGQRSCHPEHFAFERADNLNQNASPFQEDCGVVLSAFLLRPGQRWAWILEPVHLAYLPRQQNRRDPFGLYDIALRTVHAKALTQAFLVFTHLNECVGHFPHND
jgi:hypothetical protein